MPLLVAVGASSADDRAERIAGGMTYGVLSMDSFGFGLPETNAPQAAIAWSTAGRLISAADYAVVRRLREPVPEQPASHAALGCTVWPAAGTATSDHLLGPPVPCMCQHPPARRIRALPTASAKDSE